VMNYILSVVEHYLRQGIDGWRLDVGFDLGYVNNALIAKTAKSISIEKYVVTENVELSIELAHGRWNNELSL